MESLSDYLKFKTRRINFNRHYIDNFKKKIVDHQLFMIFRQQKLLIFYSFLLSRAELGLAQSWEGKTKNCKRNLLLKKIAVGIIVALGVALAATGLGFGLGGTLISAAALMFSFGCAGTISFIGYSALGMNWRDYSDPEVVKEVIQEIRNINIVDFAIEMSDSAKLRTIQKIHTYTHYGFISEEDRDIMCQSLLEAYHLLKTPLAGGDSQQNNEKLEANNQCWNEVVSSMNKKLDKLEIYIKYPYYERKYID